jgi:hypothetical protein
MPYSLILKSVKSMITEVLPVSPGFRKRTFSAVSILMRYSEEEQALALILAVSAEVVSLTVFLSAEVRALHEEKTSECKSSYPFTKSLPAGMKRFVSVILGLAHLAKERVLPQGLNRVSVRVVTEQEI